MEYFFASGNEQRGPYSLEELAGFGLRPDTLVWREGLPQWVRADALPEVIQRITPPRPPPHPAERSKERAVEGPDTQVNEAGATPHVLEGPQLAPPSTEIDYRGPTTRPPTNGMAVASLVLGIVSVPGLCTYGVGLPCAILAVIFGFVARGAIRRDGASGAGLALAGIICGFISIGLALVGLAIIIVFVIASPNRF